MKRFHPILLFFLTFNSIVNAQNLKALDLKNGFKDLKIGTTLEKVKSILAPELIGSGSSFGGGESSVWNDFHKEYEHVYNFKPNDSKGYVAFNTLLHEMQLHFVKNKLVTIILSLGVFDGLLQDEKSFDEILRQLKQAYGKPTRYSNQYDQNTYFWTGKSIELKVIGYRDDRRYKIIVFYSKIYPTSNDF